MTCGHDDSTINIVQRLLLLLLTAILQDDQGKPAPVFSILDFIGAKDDGDGGDNCSYKT